MVSIYSFTLMYCVSSVFFFNDTATTEIYTLSLHDALPICGRSEGLTQSGPSSPGGHFGHRSEEHTSELQSHLNLVCRLLLEKKNTRITGITSVVLVDTEHTVEDEELHS